MADPLPSQPFTYAFCMVVSSIIVVVVWWWWWGWGGDDGGGDVGCGGGTLQISDDVSFSLFGYYFSIFFLTSI